MPQNLLEHLPSDGDLGHLEGDIAAVAYHEYDWNGFGGSLRGLPTADESAGRWSMVRETAQGCAQFHIQQPSEKLLARNQQPVALPTLISTPIHRTRSHCCARAASGHAAAPPSSVMKSRLFTRSPRRRGRAASAVLRGQALVRFAG
jgi:hypothetical protein